MHTTDIIAIASETQDFLRGKLYFLLQNKAPAHVLQTFMNMMTECDRITESLSEMEGYPENRRYSGQAMEAYPVPNIGSMYRPQGVCYTTNSHRTIVPDEIRRIAQDNYEELLIKLTNQKLWAEDRSLDRPFEEKPDLADEPQILSDGSRVGFPNQGEFDSKPN